MTDATVEETGQEFSLADLANLDVTDIAEVRFESLPAGLYTFRGVSAKFEDVVNRDDERRLRLMLKMEVAEVKSVLDRDYKTPEAKEGLLGKVHTETQYIVPDKAPEGIGLIRSMFSDLGLPNTGALGGVEGQPEGMVDAFVGHEFPGKIIAQPRKGDPTQKDARLRLEKAKA